jgi:DNA polymerase sigma
MQQNGGDLQVYACGLFVLTSFPVSAHVVKQFVGNFPPLGALIRLVKFWVSKMNMPLSRVGGLSSFGWILMTVFFYQVRNAPN